MSLLSVSTIDKLWSSYIHLKTGVLSDIITEEKDADSNDNTTVPSYQIYKQATTKATSNFSEIAQKLIEITAEITEIAAKLAPLVASSPTITNQLKTLTSNVNDLSQEISGKATYWEATKVAGTDNYSYNGMIFINNASVSLETSYTKGLFLYEMNGTYEETVTFPDEIHLIDGTTTTSVQLIGFNCSKAINIATKKLIFPYSVKYYGNSGENDIQDIVANGCKSIVLSGQNIKIIQNFPSLEYLDVHNNGNLRIINVVNSIYLYVSDQNNLESINCPNVKYIDIANCSSLSYINFENFSGKELDLGSSCEIIGLYKLHYLNLSSLDSTTSIEIHEIHTLTNNTQDTNPHSLILVMNHINASMTSNDTVSLLIINRNFTYTGTTSPFTVNKILNLGGTSNETLKSYFPNSIIY